MKIDYIEILRFRNLFKVTVCPEDGINLLVGKNAQGKTNFLESLYVLANGLSFRSVRDRDLVYDGQDSYSIKIRYQVHGRNLESSVEYSPAKGRILRLNNKKVVLNHPDHLKTVLFTPDDLYIIKGSPERRRAFLDFILCQLSTDYERNLDNYTKILKKRNSFLKMAQSSTKSFNLVDDLFVETAAPLILARINLISLLEKEAIKLYRQLSDEKGKVSIKYALSFGLQPGKPGTELIMNSMRKALAAYRDKELLRRATLVGPHRDDMNVYLQGRNTRIHASQGQQRNLAVVLKLTEMAIIKSVKGYFPVLLLDEVLAELDQERRLLLLSYLANAGFQSFLSSVDRELVVGRGGKAFLVANGSVTEEV